MSHPIPTDEERRLAALRGCAVLDTPPEAEYDGLTRLAALVCGTPIALVSLVDSCRQWFKSRHGLDAAETPRDVAFCAHAILGTELFVVPDAAADPRFRDNPLVTGGPGVRFYAGAPLTTPDGLNLGTLCVIDRVPRALPAEQADGLRVLAGQVVAQLLLRRRVEAMGDQLREHETFRVLFEHSSDAHLIFDERDGIIDCNAAAVAMLRCRDKDEVLTLHPAALSPEAQPDGRRSLEKCVEMDATARRLGHHRFDWTHRRMDGEEFPCEVTLTPVDLHGRSVLLVVWHDLTDRKRAEDALRLSEAKFRNTVDRLAEGVYVVDAGTGRPTEANAAILAMLGYTADEFTALDLFDLVAGETPDVFARNAREIGDRLARDGRCDLGRRRYRRKDGSEVPVDVRVSVVPAGGSGLHAVIVRDVTEELEAENRVFAYQSELEEANAKLRALAVTDGLTGVNNRAGFNARLAEEYDRAVRHGRVLSVILADVDHFKLFNDTFGHPAGDEVLRAVARTLRASVRSPDFVARYGGEEFAVILPDTNYAGAMVLAERCRRAVAGAGWDRRPVTVSVGVATLTPATAAAAALVREADEALYRSKQAGRNRVNHGSGTVPVAATTRA